VYAAVNFNLVTYSRVIHTLYYTFYLRRSIIFNHASRPFY